MRNAACYNTPVSEPRRILVLYAHPAPHHSRVNVRMAEAVRGLSGVTFHDLYETYPALDLDVPREQERLAAHDAVVLQHPLFWYSTPAILKEWQDLVLTHGWAYGRDGTALAGKLWLNAVTAGGGEDTYRPDGAGGRTVRDYLAPLESTAKLCGMRWLEPFVVHGTHRLDAPGIERSAADYRRRLETLRDGGD